MKKVRKSETKTSVRRIAFYARVSTRNQAMIQEGSLKSQIQRLNAEVERRNIIEGSTWGKLVEEYVDEARSGKDMNRPEFQRLLNDIASGRINTVMVVELSRISRSVSDFLSFIDFLRQHEADFICPQLNFDTTTPAGRVFITILAALSQFERELTVERTIANMRARAQRGLYTGGRPPLGYDLHPEKRGHLVVNEGEAALVRRIYETYISVGSVELTVRSLNKAGFRNKLFKTKNGHMAGGQRFTDNAITRVLQNPLYLGKRKIEDEEGNVSLTDSVWPAIVSNEIALAAKEKMESNRNWFKPEGFSEHPYLLSAMISCGECGGSLSGAMAHGRTQEIPYYQHAATTTCTVKRVQAKRLVAVILQKLRKIKDNPILAEELAKGSADSVHNRIPELESQAASIENNVREFRKKAANLLNYLADLPNGADPKLILGQVQEFEEKAKAHEEERENVYQQIRELKASVVSGNQVTNHLKAFFKEFETLNLNEKRDALGCVLSSIRVFPEKLELGYWVGALASARSLSGVTSGSSPDSNRHSLGRWFGKRESWRPERHDRPNQKNHR